ARLPLSLVLCYGTATTALFTLSLHALFRSVVPGFYLRGAGAALIAALVIGFINATLGLFLKIITFPLTVITFGLFWFVINAAMLELASAIVPGFEVRSFWAAFWGAVVLSLVNMLLRWLVRPP